MPRQKIKEGDIFEISLENEERAFGQLLSVEPKALNSVGVALWEPSTSCHIDVLKSPPIAVLLVTPDLLKKGSWPIIGNSSPVVPLQLRPYEQFRSKAWVGVKIIGSGIIEEFMSACAGLQPWNEWANPHYLDGLLIPGAVRPARAVESCS